MTNLTPQTKNYLIILGLSILFYLPYILHTFYNRETVPININSVSFSVNPLPDMITMLKTQYNPLNGFFMWYFLPYKIGVSSQILILLGVIFFSIALYGFVNFFVPTLSRLSKLIIYLLAFCNPYIFMESGWWGQFMGQGIVSLLYLISFVLIDKYKNLPNSFKKIAYAYGLPIFSVVFGLNFFMPSFFHFVVLAFLYVVKSHLENPFNSIKEFFIFSMPLFIIMGLGAVIYAIEIKITLACLDITITDGRIKTYDVLSSFSELKNRMIKVVKQNPKAYLGLVLICAGMLFFVVKRNRLNFIFILLTPVVILVSYSFLIILNIDSGTIKFFSNYYLFVFLLAFILLYLKNCKLKIMLKIASICLIVFFYFCSYFFAVWGLRHEEVMKTELAKLEKVAYSQFEKGSPIFIIGRVNDWDKKLIKRPSLVKVLFSRYGYGNYKAIDWSFNGTCYGFKNITAKNTVFITKPKEQAILLRKQGKIYPNTGSMFLYNGTIYVVGD